MKKTVTLSALLALSSSIVNATPTIAVSISRSFFMTAPKTATYTGGATSVFMNDGSIAIWGDCELDPSAVYIAPFTANPFPDCPSGTTGLIMSGDINKDGVADDRQFWSVASANSASYMEAFLPEKILLSAAPPSKLQRPKGDFVDDSLGLFFNTVSQEIDEYNIATYRYNETFTDYADHHETWVPGVYIYSVPKRRLSDDVTTPSQVPLQMTITSMIEANGYRKGLLGFGVVTKQWSNGAQEMDPRLISVMAWEGTVRANTITSDLLKFGIRDSMGDIQYPTTRGLLTVPSNVQTTLKMLPYAFAKGETGVAQISCIRNKQTSVLASENGVRDFFWNMRFIDSYTGHIQYEYRFVTAPAVTGIKVAGVIKTLGAAAADYDGDGLSNIIEFAFSQDDGNDLSSSLEWTTFNQFLLPAPVLPLGITAPIGVGPVFVDTLAAGVPNTPLSATKRANVGASITYGYQVNYNTADPKSKWVAIKGPIPGGTLVVKDTKAGALAGNPNFTWTITDTFDTAAVVLPLPLPATTGTTTIQASDALPPTVRVRSTAAVTSGY